MTINRVAKQMLEITHHQTALGSGTGCGAVTGPVPGTVGAGNSGVLLHSGRLTAGFKMFMY